MKSSTGWRRGAVRQRVALGRRRAAGRNRRARGCRRRCRGGRSAGVGAHAARAAGRHAPGRRAGEVMVDADGGQLIAAVDPGSGDTLRWAAVLVRPSPTLQSWRLLVVALGFSALLLVGSAAYSLISVRRAVAALQAALAALGDDLSAPVPRSQIGELDDIALGRRAAGAPVGRVAPGAAAHESRAGPPGATGGAGAGGRRRRARGPQPAGVDQAAPGPGGRAATSRCRASARAAVEHATAEIARLDRLVADLLIVAGRAPGTRSSVGRRRPGARARRGADPLGGAAPGDASRRRGAGGRSATPTRWPAPSTTSCATRSRRRPRAAPSKPRSRRRAGTVARPDRGPRPGRARRARG